MLLSAGGLGTVEIMRRTGKSKTCVWRWQERFAEEGVDGLLRDKTRPPRVAPLGQEVIDRVVALTATEPPHEATHWTAPRWPRRPASASPRCSASGRRTASRRTALRRFKLSNDPDFVPKLKDIVGLYVDPPAHAVVLSVDEKSQIQALDRTQPGLPMKKGRAGTMTHDYKRHGTTTLFAALNVLDGTVIGRCMQRHRHQEFIRFLNAIEATGPGRQGRPRHPRQLRRPQAAQGAGLARPPSALDLPLHPDLVLLAQRRRGLLRQAHQAPTEARRLPLRRRPPGRHQPLLDEANHDPKPFVWTADPDKIIAAVNRGCQTLESIH